jgi:integrase
MSDIRKRTGKNGATYQVRYVDLASSTGYSYQTFTTAKEARAFREGPKQSPVGAMGKTVAQAVDEWLKICATEGRDGRPPVSDATMRYYRYIGEGMKVYPWQTGVRGLTKADIVAFRSSLIAEKGRYLAAKTLTYFHAVLAEMASRNHVATNVATGVSVRQETRYSEPVEIPTQLEIQALLKAADDLANSKNMTVAKTWARYRPMLYLAVDSGMRPQEYVAICGKNLLETGVRVERAIDRSGKLSVTKTPAARRFIELSEETLNMLVHYRDHVASPNDYDLVFPTSTGHWQSLDSWRKRCFVAACKKAGLVDRDEVDGVEVEKARYSPYALRHYFASVLIAEGTDIAKIKTLMGHTDISTTFDVYAHLIQQAEDTKSRRTGMIAKLKSEGIDPERSRI